MFNLNDVSAYYHSLIRLLLRLNRGEIISEPRITLQDHVDDDDDDDMV
jgi:hypothetical protein